MDVAALASLRTAGILFLFAALVRLPRNHAVPAVPFRRVKSPIGTRHCHIRMRGTIGNHAADADAAGQLDLGGAIRKTDCRNAATKILGHQLSRGVRGARQQYREFFASVAREQIVRPADPATQRIGDGDDAAIANAVPESIVDILEVIDVDDHDGDDIPLPGSMGPFARETFVEMASVA
jgi:hypothetical protein